MMGAVSIGYAQKDDCAELSGVIAEVIQAIPYYNDTAKRSEIQKFIVSNLEQKIEEDIYSIVVARVDDQIAGFCSSRFDDYTIWLEWFGVAQAFRGMSISKSLLKKLEETVAPRQCHKIWCDCRTTNKASIHLLTVSGYRQLATIPNHWYGQDFILWEKTI